MEWYDELLRFADTPIVRLNRAVAVGEADGAPAGLAALAQVDEHVPRRDAVAAHLHEKNGDLEVAARLYAEAARNAPNLAERDHQTRQAAGSTSSCKRAADAAAGQPPSGRSTSAMSFLGAITQKLSVRSSATSSQSVSPSRTIPTTSRPHPA